MIKIQNLNLAYGDKKVYENFCLDIEKGKTTVLLGESGCGKTTLIHALANLIDCKNCVSGIEYPVSMVFQNDRLIKNLTVKENLEIVNKNIDTQELLQKIGLAGYENAYIKSLSAGMKRRLAILRALIFDAKVMLFDEPFINLDLKLKYSLMDKIKREKGDKTLILVTHDIKEAVYLADRIIVLKKGKVDLDINVDEQKELLEDKLFKQLLKD